MGAVPPHRVFELLAPKGALKAKLKVKLKAQKLNAVKILNITPGSHPVSSLFFHVSHRSYR